MKALLLFALSAHGCVVSTIQNDTNMSEDKNPKTTCDALIHEECSTFSNSVNFESCHFDTLLAEAKIELADSVTSFLGLENTPSVYWEFSKSEQEQLKIWKQGDKLAKIDVIRTLEDPQLILDQLKALGEPTKKLDYYFGMIKLKQKAYIFPEKGIAVFLGTIDNSVFKWSFFPKTTIEEYEKNLHPTEVPREFEE